MKRSNARSTLGAIIACCAGALAGCADGASQPAEPPPRTMLLLRPVIAPALGRAPDEAAQAEETRTARDAGPVADPAPSPVSAVQEDPNGVDNAPPPPDPRLALEANLAAARAAFDANPRDEDAAIWLGRRLAYLGRFDDAIAVFSDALRAHPRSYRLLRHRGHRFITVRRFDDAISDLNLAAILAAEGDAPSGAGRDAGVALGSRMLWDEIEPDGAPNELHVPRSTTRFNIYYHLGLALWLRGAPGDLERAAAAYARCLEHAARNDDMTVAAANWAHLTLRRLERVEEADAALAPIHPGMNVPEDADYLTLCLLHKGELTPEEAAERAGKPGTTRFETIMFGVGMLALFERREADARRAWEAVVHEPTSAKASFGYLASERALARLERK